MAKHETPQASGRHPTKVLAATAKSASRAAVSSPAGRAESVILNTPISVRTRTGLAKLKGQYGFATQGKVIEQLVKEALARSRSDKAR